MTTKKRKSKDIEYFSGNRAAVLKRDKNKCVLCGDTYLLCVHHKDGRGKGYKKAERNDSLDNLIALCHTCHRKIHRKYPHCQMSNCKLESYCRGFCRKHYAFWWRRVQKTKKLNQLTTKKRGDR